jgi:L-alanine-DL-glutamate epimerase-like enolase superfamily enzyme
MAAMPVRTLTSRSERWPLAEPFAISRGTKSHADVVVAEIREGRMAGRGECVPYPRYGETVAGVLEAIQAQSNAIAAGMTREELQTRMAPGAARNALDCALWDLEAKRAKKPVWALAGLARPRALQTAYTISLADQEMMAAKAKAAAGHGLLKIKLGTEDDADRLAAIRAARADARLIVDANEGWRSDALPALLAACADAGVELVEQPLPADEDDRLAAIDHPVPVCADESVHDRAGLDALAGRYDAVNIKLDKTGGLTEALALAEGARAVGLGVMVGCMVATSLAMAPALLVAQSADLVDLDGPLLLARDREGGLAYSGDRVAPPDPGLWG